MDQAFLSECAVTSGKQDIITQFLVVRAAAKDHSIIGYNVIKEYIREGDSKQRD
jgi:hypothetical protein